MSLRTAHDLPLISDTQGSADVDMLTRLWFARFWETIRSWLRAHSFYPKWLNAPWNRPVMGYLVAILTPVGAIILTFLLLHLFSTFAFPGALMILALLGVALLWGTGPGLLATLWGTILLNSIILPPRFSWSLNTLEYIFETCLFLFAGIIISLVTSRIEREREEARANELALREANRRMDEFLGIVSHELRTPLTTIKGNIQLARLRLRSSLREVPADNDVLPSMLEEIQRMLERAERQANVQNRMVGDLLDISRPQADKFELRLVSCDLVTIVLELVEDQRSTTPKRVIYLKMPKGEMAPVITDTERIGQVLNNFLTNALKYSPVDRPVEVQLKKEGNMMRVLVRDEGPGLTPLEQEQIWERFYHVEGIMRQRGASVRLGLGLHICREIVEQHKGEVGVESTKGEGSTFWFTLPLVEPDDQEAASGAT